MSTRTRILRRRAAFLTSTLAVIGCGGPTRTQPAPAPVTVPSGSAQPEEPDPGPPEAPPTAGRSGMPSLEVPEDINEQAHERFVGMVKQVQELHATLDEVEDTLGQRCSVLDPACEPTWRELAKQLLQVNGEFRWMHVVCKGSSEGAKLFEERQDEHREFLQKRVNELLSSIESGFSSRDELKRWKALWDEEELARPQICLSYGCSDW